jgi:hypothetical protein
MSANGIFLGSAGVFYVMSQLAVREFHAACTHGNAPSIDIIVANKAGSRSISIQVKSARNAMRWKGSAGNKAPNKLDFTLGYKATQFNSPALFFAFVDFLNSNEARPVTYLVPSTWVHGFCRSWATPDKMVRFQPDIGMMAEFKEAWHLLDKALQFESGVIDPAPAKSAS